MGKGAEAPDYKVLQDNINNGANQQTAANRPTINTPWAQQSWAKDAQGNWTQNNSLQGGGAQAAAGLTNQLGLLGQPMDWNQFGKVGSGDDARNQAITSAWDQSRSRLDPMWDQREEKNRTRLLNQGLSADSGASRNFMSDFGRDRNDAYSSAMSGAIAQGTSAGDSAFRNNMMSQQNAISNALRQRQQPMDEMRSLQGFLNPTGFNQDNSTLAAAMGSAGYADKAYQQAEQRRKEQEAAVGEAGGAALGALASSGALAALFSL